MNVGKPESGAEREQLFSGWVTKQDLGGFSTMNYWVNHEAMPDGSGDVYREWRDEVGHGREKEQRALDLAKQFEELTGFKPEEFKEYIDELNKK